MKAEDVSKLKLGLYRIYWTSGGSSLASVGNLYDGRRWFAPTNWTNESTTGIASADWSEVESVQLISEAGRASGSK